MRKSTLCPPSKKSDRTSSSSFPHRTPKGLAVETLEGRLNLSTLFGLVNTYSVEIPTTGVYDVTLRNTGTRTGIRQIAVDETSAMSPLWIQRDGALNGAAQGEPTATLSLTAGEHLLRVDASTGTVTDLGSRHTAFGSTLATSTTPVTFTSTPTTLTTPEEAVTPISTETTDMAGAPGGNTTTTSGSTKTRRNSLLAMAPTAPTNFTATAISSSQITLNWRDNSNNETGFKIERALAGTDAWVQIATVGTNVKSYADTGLSSATAYTYRVCATNSTGDSPFAVAEGTTAAILAVPAAPTSLVASAVSPTEIGVVWTDNSSNESGFEVERALVGTDQWVRLTTVSADVNSYMDGGLKTGTAYEYRVRAVNLAGGSDWAMVTASTPQVAPVAPTSLSAAPLSATQIALTWADGSNNETGFVVERSTDGKTWGLLVKTSANSTRHDDSGLAPSTNYFYRVTATNSAGESAPVTVQAGTPQAAPGTPSGLLATVDGPTQVTLAWADNSSNETGFRIERSDNGGPWSVRATTEADETRFVDIGLTAGTTYQYRLSAVNEGGASGYASVSLATPSENSLTGAPAAPGTLVATGISSSEVTLMWADSSDNETGFEIDRRVEGSENWTRVTTTSANVNTFADGGLAAGTTYEYRIRAVNADGGSGYVMAGAATLAAPVVPPAEPVTPPTTQPVASGVVLLPGTGFTGATAEPGQIGTGTAANEKAIARWDVVPYQTFDKTFNVSVVAFHINGIDRVEFSVNGGTWAAVTQATLNPETGVVEYWATLDATKFAKDGAVEVRAIAYPRAGVPRVLESLTLNTNANQTLGGVVKYVSPTGDDTTGDGSVAKPFKTITTAAMAINKQKGTVDGSTIYLMAGDHVMRGRAWNEYPVSSSQWLTITRAPGLAKDAVRLNGKLGLTADDSGLGVKLVKISGITVTEMVNGTAGGFVDRCWYDDVDMKGPGRFRAMGDTSALPFREVQFDYKYITNSTVRDMPSAPDGVQMWRNTKISMISGSAFHETPLVLNCSLVNSDREGNTDIHPDVLQYANDCENVVWYGVTATDHIESFGVRFNKNAINVAIVNCNLQVMMPQVAGFGTQTYKNVFWKNNTLAPGFDYYPPFDIVNVVFESNTFLGGVPKATGIVVR